MADGEHPLVLVERSPAVPLVPDAADAASEPHVRLGVFLRPRAGDGAALPAPPGDPSAVPALPAGIEAEFRGWAGVPRRWQEWVDKLRRRHEPLWRELGILGGILASTCWVRRREHEHALLQLAPFWSVPTATFVFPWGEATLTLEDMHALAGLPLVGVSVREHVSNRLEKDVGDIELVRALLNRTKAKKPSYTEWVNRFVDRVPEEAPPPSVAGGSGGGGDRKARDLLVEHGAFLAMWLSFFVLPGPPFDVVRREVLPLAARLARGQSVALAPAALASIYHDLSELKRRIASGTKNSEPFVVSAPAHILQLWVWEHFTQLSPKPVAASARGDRAHHDMPRTARWHEAVKPLSSEDVHAAFMSPKKKFKWRPYGDRSLFGLQTETGRFWTAGTSEQLLSLRRCLHACELVGMDCVQQYSPHRVARQLGFDQDIPGTVLRARSSSCWQEAWERYNIDLEGPAFLFPTDKPGVTVEYAKWWKPYSSSACGSATANAAKSKEGRHDFVSPAKRTVEEGVLAGNSGKKRRLPLATATRGVLPNLSAGIKVNTSQSSGSSHAAAVGRAAAAPAPDAADDHISLSERLNSIIKMRKQPSTKCDESSSKGHQVSAMHLKSRISGTKMSPTGERNEDTKLVDATVQTYDGLLKGPTEAGNSERLSSRLLDGNTEKDANKLPTRAVSTVETTEKASANRQAKIAKLNKKINTLKQELRELQAASNGKSPK